MLSIVICVPTLEWDIYQTKRFWHINEASTTTGTILTIHGNSTKGESSSSWLILPLDFVTRLKRLFDSFHLTRSIVLSYLHFEQHKKLI